MRFLVYSHVFISICALALTIETIIVYGLPIRNVMPYLGLVFFSTLLAYSTKSILGFGMFSIHENSDKKNWISKNEKNVFVIFIISLVFVLLFSFWLNSKLTWLILFPLAIFSLGYSLPFSVREKKIVLREVPFFKTILVALVWAVVVAYIPFLESGVDVVVFRFVEMFLFLFSLAILFDIKDVSEDRLINLKTIPIQIGIKGTKVLSTVLLLSWGLVVFINGGELSILPLILSLIFAIFILFYTKPDRNVFFYMFWIDGLMLVKAFSVILFYGILK